VLVAPRRLDVAVDLAIPALVLAAALPRDAQRVQLTPTAAVLYGALLLPLLWRRRHPTPVFLVVAAVCLVQWVVDVHLAASVSLLVALHAVAAYDTRRRAWGAAGVVALGVVLAVVRWAPAGTRYVALLLLSGFAAAPFVAGMSARTRRAYLSALEERAEQLERDRDQHGRIAAAAERARIAGELHDVVAHHVSVMVTLADGARLTAPGDPATAARTMTQVSATGRQALGEMRRLLGVLGHDRGDAALSPQPGLEDIGAMVDGVRATGLEVTLVQSGSPVAVPAGAALVVYRVVQEALTNTLKHARSASGARVDLAYTARGVDVMVSDDGTAPIGVLTRGFGVAGMRERAAVYGGTLAAGPDPVGGWRVALHLDLGPPA